MDFTICKLEQTISRLFSLAVKRSVPLTERFSAPDPLKRHEPEKFLQACEGLSFLPFGEHDRWGQVNESRVFLLPVTVPREFSGEDLYLKLTTGREGGYTAFNPQFLAYVDGSLHQGMDINHTLVKLCDKARAGCELQVLLHAFAGTEPGLMELKTELVSFRKEVRQLAFAFLTAYQTMIVLPELSGQRAELCQALLKTADCLDFRFIPGKDFDDSVSQAQSLLEQLVYSREWGPSPVQVHAVGHTHIDIAWRWTVEQSRQKVQRSFSTVLSLMEKYPDYRFFSSQPVLYQFVKEDNPTLYEKIREKIREGRWEAEGGMWLEADCNLPCGESLVRQIYYGKKFLRDEFGVESEILWMPDSFGYSAVLPQLMQQAGLKYFITSKLSWNEFNRIPHDVFLWEGLDGSRVLACMITTPDDCGLPNSPDFSTYNATLQPKNVLGVWERMTDKQVTRHVIMPYGYGDGGGGPTEEMLEIAAFMGRGLPGLPALELSRADRFFHTLEKDVLRCPRLPRFRGELYLEFHRGTYTSVAQIKRSNRRAELGMLAAEFACAVAGKKEGARREKIWKSILLHQFHDVLPGSAIEEVYRQAEPEYQEIQAGCRLLTQQGVQALMPGGDTAFCLVNPLWEAAPQVVFAHLPEGTALGQGAFPVSSQRLPDGRTALFFPSLPALSVSTFPLVSAESDPVWEGPGMAVSPNRLENDFFAITLDDAGEISSLYDKRARREVLRPGCTGNALLLFEDRPATCDAWNIDVNYVEKEYPVRSVREICVTENGPVCAAVTIRRDFLHSHAVQTIRIFRHIPRIDFETEIDWHEEQNLLKASFPVDVHAQDALCGIQFGNLRRPVSQSNSWEEARFEEYAHGYVDLSEGDYGVSLFLGDKYGFDTLDGGLRLTLLKGPVEPWRGADEGVHRFTYSLFPHEGDFFAAKGYLASAFDRILAGQLEDVQAGGKREPLSWRAETVSVEAVKPAEDGDGFLLRLCEYGNRRCTAELCLPGCPARFWECSLLEEDLREIPQKSGKVLLEFRPYEIKTIRVRQGSAPSEN